jgi:uncharacterized membrane protein
MKFIPLVLAATVTVLTLSACGSSTSDRAITGAGIGAGVGAVGGLLLGDPVTGALIGGAVGGATGALTKEDQVNLGKPVWK